MKISFIGGGNMASSIIGGIIQSRWDSQNITACDPSAEKCLQLEKTLNIKTSRDNNKGIQEADIIILATKPQVLQQVAKDLSAHINSDALIISIAAGVTCSHLKKWLHTENIIIRTMPNTPALVRQGMTGIYCPTDLSPAQKSAVDGIFNSIGKTLWVDNEQKIDAITAISGSGPAYFFLFFEAVENTAKALGLEPHEAAKLIQQTALGAATMALESNETSQTLKENVMSPGGTTEQAINTFMEQQLPKTISQALLTAFNRSIELSK